MKYVLSHLIFWSLLSGTILAVERPAQRQAKEAMLGIELMNSPCNDLTGAHKTYCQKEFITQKKKSIKELVKMVIHDDRNGKFHKISLDIQEEKALIKYQALLDGLGVAWTAELDSTQLKSMYSIEMDEITLAANVLELQNILTSYEVSYLPEDGLAELTLKLEEYYAAQPAPDPTPDS